MFAMHINHLPLVFGVCVGYNKRMKHITLNTLIYALNRQKLRAPSAESSLQKSLETGSHRLATEQNLRKLMHTQILRRYSKFLTTPCTNPKLRINLDIVETILYNDLFVLDPK